MTRAVDMRRPVESLLPQPPHDVLDVDDRVVDDDADGNHQPGQDHRVDHCARPVQHQPRGHQRNGIAITLISAVRHSKRNATMIKTTSRQPMSNASVRLSIASSMKVAGRKIEVSISIPVRPGRSSSIAASTPW